MFRSLLSRVVHCDLIANPTEHQQVECSHADADQQAEFKQELEDHVVAMVVMVTVKIVRDRELCASRA